MQQSDMKSEKKFNLGTGNTMSLGNLFISKEFIRHSGRDERERALKKSFTITAVDYALYFIFWSSMDRLENVKTKIT